MNFMIIGFFTSLIFGGICFIASENIISSAALFIITLLFFVLVLRKKISKYQQKTHRYHQCYQFINTYLVSLSIKGSMTSALESGYDTADNETKEIIDSIKELDEEEKLSYLNKYFRFDLYHLFLDTVALWNEQGGDVLAMSQYLMNQVRLKEEYLLTCESKHRSKVLEFTVLWTIALLILAVLRFALSQFFSFIAKTLFYQVAIIVIFLFVIVSIYIMVNRITNIVLEGWKDEEK